MILVFKSSKYNPTNVPSLTGTALRVADMFKDLGLIITNDLKDDLDVECIE